MSSTPSRDEIWNDENWIHMKARLDKRSQVQDNGCTFWTGAKDAKGYGLLHGSRAHIWSYMCHNRVGPRLPKGSIVRHSCNTPACINVEHLLLGSSLDNAQDRVKAGRSALGEMSSKSKISTQIARQIKYDNKGTASQIAHRYDVPRNWLGETSDKDDRTRMSNQKKSRAIMLQPYSKQLYREGRFIVRNRIKKTRDEEGEHWLYDHANQQDDYARIRFNGLETNAHRHAFRCYNQEEVPPKTAVRHRCHVKICVNPEHLLKSTAGPTVVIAAEPKRIVEDVVLRSKIATLEAHDDEWKAQQTDQIKAVELLQKTAQFIEEGDNTHWILENSTRGKIWFNGSEWCVSRLSWYAHYGVEPPFGKFVLRQCSQALCFNPDHLFLADNAAANHCTQAEKNGMAKITSVIALAIFNEKDTMLQTDRAAKYKVSVSTVKAIDQGRQWSSATGHYCKDGERKRKRVKKQLN